MDEPEPRHTESTPRRTPSADVLEVMVVRELSRQLTTDVAPEGPPPEPPILAVVSAGGRPQVCSGFDFADRDCCSRSRAEELSSVTLSLPSHVAATLDELTGHLRSWERIVEGLENLASVRVPTAIAHVISPHNYRSVAEFVRFMHERFPSFGFRFAFATPVAPEFARPELVVRLSDAVAPLREALDYCLQSNITFDGLSGRCGLPECLLSGDLRYFPGTSRIWQPARSDEFMAVPACNNCVRRDHCHRVRKLYAFLFGTAEFRPIVRPGVLGDAPVPTGLVAGPVGRQGRATAATVASHPDPAASGQTVAGPRVDAQQSASQQLFEVMARVGARLSLSQERVVELTRVERKLCAPLVVSTRQDQRQRIDGLRMRYANRAGPTVGPIEASPALSEDGCRAAAVFRGLRAAAFGIAMGGAHGGLVCDPSVLELKQLEAALSALIRTMDSGATDPPDFLTPHTTLPWDLVCRCVERHGRGRTRLVRRRSAVRGAPAAGMPSVTSAVAAALFAAMRYRNPGERPLRYTIWGFGRAGQRVSELLEAHRPDARLVGCADSRGACVDLDGLDADRLRRDKSASGRLPLEPQGPAESILSVAADVLFLTGKGAAVDVQSAEAVQASVVVDMTGSLASDAEQELIRQGSLFMPSAVTTSGSMLMAWLELESGDDVLPCRLVEERIVRCVADIVPRMLSAGERFGLTMTEAVVALGMRGLTAAAD